jgi:hypothetical protein
MLDLFRTLKVAVVLAVVALMGAPTASRAETGSVQLTITRVGFIVGVGGGSGTLVLHGRSYPLNVGGVSLGTIGAARADLVGRVYNLRRPSDIVGTYTAVSAGLSLAGGARTARLRNSNNVIIEVRGRQVGFEVSLDLSGMTISMR